MKKLTIENIKKDVELQQYGVYKIYLYSKDKPITINRFLENDKNCLLYIGAAERTKIKNRLINFLRTKDLDFKQKANLIRKIKDNINQLKNGKLVSYNL